MKHMIYTLGHSTRPITEFISLLQANNIGLVADVRTIPRSRHNPQYDGPAFRNCLRSHRIVYHHFPKLGGLRKARKDSPNTAWRNASFRGYADYMQSEEFCSALQKLIKLASNHNLALVCAESVPWRCHRNLIADALLAREISVEHIMGFGKKLTHQLTPWIKIRGKSLTYPGPQSTSQMKRAKPMSKEFKVGDRVSWNSEAGRVRGRIMKKVIRATRFKGYVHHASPEDPQYLIESEKTGHVALHRGTVLRKLKAPSKRTMRATTLNRDRPRRVK